MEKNSQLLALKKAAEIEEQQAALEHSVVQEVVENRQKKLALFEEEKAKLLGKIAENNAANVLSLGRGDLAACTDSFVERLRKELAKLEPAIKSQIEDLNSALERARLSHDRLIKARLELKSIEKLIEQRTNVSMQKDLAVEEEALDEFSRKKT